MTQGELAKALGKAYQQVSEWERGNSNLRAANLHAVAKALGVSPAWLATGEGRMAPTMEEVLARDYDLHPMVSESETPYRHEQIDLPVLTQALTLVLQELQNRKATLPPSKIAAAVVEIYDLVTSQGKKEVAVDNVTPFVRLLLAR